MGGCLIAVRALIWVAAYSCQGPDMGGCLIAVRALIWVAAV